MAEQAPVAAAAIEEPDENLTAGVGAPAIPTQEEIAEAERERQRKEIQASMIREQLKDKGVENIDDIASKTAKAKIRYRANVATRAVEEKFEEVKSKGWRTQSLEGLIRSLPDSFVVCPNAACGFVFERVTDGLDPFKEVVKGADGKQLHLVPTNHYLQNRFRCRMCATEFCASCKASPYHLGYTCEEQEIVKNVRECRFCREPADDFLDRIKELRLAEENVMHTVAAARAAAAAASGSASGSGSGSGSGASSAASSGSASGVEAVASASSGSGGGDGAAPSSEKVEGWLLDGLFGDDDVLGESRPAKPENPVVLVKQVAAAAAARAQQKANEVVCAKAECKEKLKNVCPMNAACGHLCISVNKSISPHTCLCLRPGCKDAAQQNDEEMCSVCWIEDLRAAPCLKLKCGHTFHEQCLMERLKQKWPTAEISFGFMKCPTCNVIVDASHAAMTNLLRDLKILEMETRKKALFYLKLEKLDGNDALKPGGKYHNKEEEFALETFTFYHCFKCKHPYYGGMRDCQRAVGGQAAPNPAELICSGCSGLATCDKHGTEYVQYKCRFCCSIATYFCFGMVHYCTPCHNRPYDYWDYSNKVLTKVPPQCPGQETCPLKQSHPPNGFEEYALGCMVCIAEEQMRVKAAEDEKEKEKGKAAAAAAAGGAPADAAAGAADAVGAAADGAGPAVPH